MLVTDTCVTCHLGKNKIHTFEPDVSTCQTCHTDAKNFDIDGVQTEVKALIDQVSDLLVAKGLLDEDGHPIVGTYPAAQAQALWNWIYVAHEDKSFGVHNADYARDLLNAAVAALQ
jgi:hypothetical protein